MGYSGYMYIWQNGREGEPFVEERLDKACASLKWSKLYPAAKVRHLTASYSDHNPIVINTNPMHHQQIRRKQKLHRFEEKWVAHPECEEVVRDSWIHTQPLGSPMYCLFKKIKRYRAQLVAWGKSTFNNTKARLTEKQRELEELVKQGYAPNLECIKLLRREVNELIHHEEVFWRQWPRSLWLSAGDKNTRFFHQRASQRTKKNTIDGLYNENGVWQTDEGRVFAIAERYYAELFKAQSHTNMDWVLDDVDKVVTNEMVQFLNQPYSKENVRRALFSMHPSKSPGPDGMSLFFF